MVLTKPIELQKVLQMVLLKKKNHIYEQIIQRAPKGVLLQGRWKVKLISFIQVSKEDF